MLNADPFVYIVDDDPAVRDSLQWLVESVGMRVQTFATGTDFLEGNLNDKSGCVILDIRMPGMSGTEVFEEMKVENSGIPVIFLTGHGDVHLAVRAMKSGAFDFIEKPFNDQNLLDLIQQAMRRDEDNRGDQKKIDEIRERIQNLSTREREVMENVVGGNSNRIIAEKLELSEKTIEFHRAKLMEKMMAASLADLIRMVTAYDKVSGNKLFKKNKSSDAN
ncbi:MAG: response regulator transcription factor [Rhodospirillales bacterium]|nr:response regulator transcription factor [Rhodospirillales bacterium]